MSADYGRLFECSTLGAVFKRQLEWRRGPLLPQHLRGEAAERGLWWATV